jgi:DNA polymerase-3 subunit gamma/tau
MLSQSAFNAFLKTLEEPPPYAIFILATTEKHKIIPTILSRCQVFDFKRIQIKDIIGHLDKICRGEGIEAADEALHVIAQKADGALRDALSIFDRIVSFSGNKITYEDVITNLNVLDYDYYFRLTDALLSQDLREVLLIFDDIQRNGFEGDHFINGLAEHLRNLLVCKDEETLRLLEISDSLQEQYRRQAALAPSSFLLTAMNLCNDCDINYKMARAKRLHVEMTLIKMCYIGQAVQLATGSGQGTTGSQQQAAAQEKKTADLKVIPPSPAKKPEKKPEDPTEAPPAKSAGNTDNQGTPAPEAQTKNKPGDSSETGVQKDITGSYNVTGNLSRVEEPLATTPIQEHFTPASSLRKPKSGSLPTLASLDSLHAEVKEAESNGINQQNKAALLTQTDLNNAWAAYMEALDKDSVKAMMKGADINLEGEQVVVVVGSALAENTIRQETALMPFLRENLAAPALSLMIKLDPSRSNAIPAKPKRLTDSEKYWAMKSINPLVDEVRKRFDLTLEGGE